MSGIKKVIAGIAALAALALGGAAIANAGGGSDHPATPAPSQSSDLDKGQTSDQPGDDANEGANEKADSEQGDDHEKGEANDGPDRGEQE